MTILPIGSKNHLSFLKKTKKKNAFSFIEVMMTIGILSFGLIFIYKAFFLSLNYFQHLNCRFYAVNLVNSKIARTQKVLELRKDLRLGERETNDQALIGRKSVNFNSRVNFRNVENVPNLYQIDVLVSWQEGAKDIRFLRSAYLTAYNPVKQ